MKKGKRTLLLTLVMMLVSSMMLAACGGKDSGSATSKDEKPVELIWYTIGTPQRDLNEVLQKVNEYTKEKINATINMKMLDWGDYDQKMQVISASGEPYDIAFTSSWGFNYVTNAQKGAFYKLNDLLDEHGQDLKNVIHPSFLEGAKINGELYAIPVNKELPAQRVFRFNDTLVKKYNFDISKVHTLEDLEPMLKTVAEKENIKPISAAMGLPQMFDYVIEGGIPIGVPLDSKDLKLELTLENPKIMEQYETMHKYYKAGYLPSDVATYTDANQSEALKTGRWFVDTAHYQPFAETSWSQGIPDKVVVQPAEEPYVYNWSVTGSMMAISAQSKYPEKAMEFINLLNTDKYLRNLINFGIEDKHYKRVDDNTIEPLPARKESYDMPQFTLGNFFILDLLPEDPKDKWDQFEAFNNSAKNAPLLGFTMDTSKVRTEIATVLNVKDEFEKALTTGTVDPKEYLPKAIEKYKAAGIEKIMEEAQRQIDEWKKSKE
ncbi:MAG: ABC transporter substrate-binding protein [Paenibacillus sp.]|uniref:Carbohydrate ABC transporter substrate-binding protein, CUT1 family n=1 Tax=Paenibacillus aquistagni TaxID=1852522 RepID=A0A1X7KV78_9BACL|nr:ABC transporter substrate-binding protein [Paenibacillus aquistagni]MBR2569713.1 ABC transporter substrate-binding protein [Paenibacillus sp.]SMG44856.1 carbohydrate ABC transporter substrate-binding protein, CUT1 family [Paenibacillus aquistagni]